MLPSLQFYISFITQITQEHIFNLYLPFVHIICNRLHEDLTLQLVHGAYLHLTQKKTKERKQFTKLRTTNTQLNETHEV